MNYDFGGLNLLVRHGVDAYLPDKAELTANQKASLYREPPGMIDPAKAEHLESPKPGVSNQLKKRVIVKHGGEKIMPCAMLELTTRNHELRYSMARKIPDLWIAQTQNFMFCQSKLLDDQASVVYDNIALTEMAPKYRECEEDHTETLRKLARLCKTIISNVKELGGPCTIIFSGNLKHDLIVEKLEPEAIFPSPSLKVKGFFKQPDEPSVVVQVMGMAV